MEIKHSIGKAALLAVCVALVSLFGCRGGAGDRRTAKSKFTSIAAPVGQDGLSYYLKAAQLLGGSETTETRSRADRAQQALAGSSSWLGVLLWQHLSRTEPDDLAAFKRRLQDAAPVLDLLRKGLDQERPSGSAATGRGTAPVATATPAPNVDITPIMRLGQWMVAVGALSQMEDKPAEAATWYLDAAKLGGDFVRVDECVAGYYIQDLALEGLIQLLGRSSLRLYRAGLVGILGRLVKLTSEQESFSDLVDRQVARQRPLIADPKWATALAKIVGLPSNSPKMKVCLQGIGSYLDFVATAAKMPYPDWLSAKIEEIWDAIGLPEEERPAAGRGFVLLTLQPSSWRDWRVTHEKIQAYLRAAAVVTALHLWNLDHHKHPVALQPLVPEYLAEIPGDPFSGRPFAFKAKPQPGDPAHPQWSLYSVGPNAQDDGGGEDDIDFIRWGGFVYTDVVHP